MSLFGAGAEVGLWHGDTALAYECVEYLVNSYWSPVMVSQHNHRDVLKMDISGGLPAVIITMLVQVLLPETEESGWTIRLLPCLPEAWAAGRLRGVRCRGGFEVDVAWEAGALTDVAITSLRGEACRVEYGERREPLELQAGESWELDCRG